MAPALRRGALRRLGTLCVAFLMVACAAQDTRAPGEQNLSLATRLFSVGYQDIADIYIDDIQVSALALAGLGNLSSLEPGVAVQNGDGMVSLLFGEQPAGAFTAPGAGDADGWGTLTATALDLARNQSPHLVEAAPEDLYETVFDGMLGALDGFSRYAGREEAHENRASRDGFGGIGVRIRLVDEGVQVLSVMEDTPAERSGLQNNDVILAIDGEPTPGLSQRDVVRRLRGPLRSAVHLTVTRADTSAPLSVKVVRAHIVPQTVKYARLGNVAHIRVSGFNQSTTRSLREKLKLATSEAADGLVGIVLDLRGNPGGLLDQAVAVSDLFVTGGRIVSTHGRHPDSHQYFDAEPDDVAKSLPVAVLINGNSASASEIVAAALQDSGRAVLIGSSSFGKGTVQTVLRLPNEGELTLTWARFHAPSGYALNKRGVLPDICTTGEVAGAEDVLARLRQGLLPIERATLRREVSDTDAAGLERLRATCPPRHGEPDIDIEVAQRLLENPALYAQALGTGTVPEAPATARARRDQAAIIPLHHQ